MNEFTVNSGCNDSFRVEVIGTGPAGKSAYEYAVEGGYKGTEPEFYAAMGSTGAASIFPSESHLSFPNVGNKYVLYIAISENRAYRWDDTELKYYCVGSDYEEIKIINGGNASGQ